MAKVEWSTGIDTVSGALNKPGSSPQHSCQKMLLGTHRTAETTNPNCNRIFLRKKSKRSTQPSTDELAKRERFAAVSAAVQTRKKDLSKITSDQQNFLAQKNQPNGKKTMRAYLWSLELALYDQAHS